MEIEFCFEPPIEVKRKQIAIFHLSSPLLPLLFIPLFAAVPW